MRIIAGEFRHRQLIAPPGLGVRPSSDRLREALFNILGGGIQDHLFVDLFAGSGAVGLEAYSRGARPVLWVEEDPAALKALRGNLLSLGLDPKRICAKPVEVVLHAQHWPGAPDTSAVCIFLDPPYADVAAYTRVLAALDARPAMAPEGALLIAEARRGVTLPQQLGRWRQWRAHAVGGTQLFFYRAESL